jgi:hypothetical protein
VYRNLPSEEAVGVMLVLAIGPRKDMIVYAKAAGRYREWLAHEGS